VTGFFSIMPLTAAGGQEAIEKLASGDVDVIVTDLVIPGMGAFGLFGISQFARSQQHAPADAGGNAGMCWKWSLGGRSAVVSSGLKLFGFIRTTVQVHPGMPFGIIPESRSRSPGIPNLCYHAGVGRSETLWMKIIGVLLILLGLTLVVSPRITYRTKEKVIHTHSIDVTATRQKTLLLSRATGVVVIVAGVAALIFAGKNAQQ
jgi:hypothetical protein